MARDDFPKRIQDALAKRVGVRCSNPACRKSTAGPRAESDRSVNIGVAAHITAASPGGPRFDSTLTHEQRQDADNGIWLCQNCAKLVDNDTTKYDTEILRNWKRTAETLALAAVEGESLSQPTEMPLLLKLSYSKKRIKSERHDYELAVTLANLGTELLAPCHIDLEMPSRVLHQPNDMPHFVPSRSTREVAFFRWSSENSSEEIYPGDVKVIMSVPYFIDDDIYHDRGRLFEQPVKATIYSNRGGFRPVTVERQFGEFQRF